MTVTRAQRFTRDHPCPICGGYTNLPQGEGIRCYGFLSEDEQYAHCTREEHAGNLDPHRDGTFVHRLVGDCRCGARHDLTPPAPSPSVRRPNGKQRRPTLTLDALAAHYGLLPAELRASDVMQHAEGVGFRSAAGLHVRKRIEKDGSESRWIWRHHKGKALFGASELSDMRAASDRIVVLESETDAIVCRALGIPAVATAGKGGWDAAFWPQLAEFATVVAWREDPDGDTLVKAMAATRPADGSGLVVACLIDPACKDPGSLLRAYGRARATALIVEAIEAAVPVAWQIETEAKPTSASMAEQPSWPEPPDDAVWHGLAGEIVAALDPVTEADRVALLATLLAAVGNIVGADPHWSVSGRRHGLRLFPVLVGPTSKGRKGTAWGAIRPMLRIAAETWLGQQVASGLSSGEGLIWAVRDPITKKEPIKERGRVTDYEEVTVDHGVDDKRLFAIEEEFASLLKVMGRETNILSAVVRQAWDDGDLRTLTKTNPARATGAHITILGHITQDELLRYLDSTEAANGFANRFLWLCVKRSKALPDGGELAPTVLAELASKLGEVFEASRDITLIERDAAAAAMWRTVYGPLSEGGYGLMGAVLSRAEAQVMRLAAIYAVLDRVDRVGVAHLEAALALWEYAEASAHYIFGDALGDPVADTILSALRKAGPLTRTDLFGLFGRHVSGSRLDRALLTLLTSGKVTREQDRDTGGRPREVWRCA